MAEKKTLEYLQRYATERHGLCLSVQYINSRIHWKCSDGHEWFSSIKGVSQNQWCPVCSGNTPKDINYVRALAKKKNGKCLSEKYVNSKTKLKWKCSVGHVWSASLNNIGSGTWCPRCGIEENARRQREQTFVEVKKMIFKRGGICLTKVYSHGDQKIKVQCHKGHTWQAVPSSIKRGSWCQSCYGNQLKNIELCHAIAISRQGKCLSLKYKNSLSPLKWMCAKGHKWQASFGNVNGGTWCPKCSGNIQLTLAEMKQTAILRGGMCISKSYKNNREKLIWECEVGHRWRAPAVEVRSGRWCQECSVGFGERICRLYFEQIFGSKFPKAKSRTLPWLKLKSGSSLELDGYCEKLKLAFEHQGRQHDRFNRHFHRGEHSQFGKQVDRDRLKENLCDLNGIKLFKIGEIGSVVNLNNLADVIRSEATRLNVKLPKTSKSISVDLIKAYSSNQSEYFEVVKSMAKSNKGKCLSSHYLGALSPLKWICEEGHIWQATPSKIKGGQWCKRCRSKLAAEKLKGSIAKMQAVARKRKGFCISKKYISANLKLKWKCNEGHVWKATPGSVVAGTWCPKCAISKRSLNGRNLGNKT